jgi:hypothetical protein
MHIYIYIYIYAANLVVYSLSGYPLAHLIACACCVYNCQMVPLRHTLLCSACFLAVALDRVPTVAAFAGTGLSVRHSGSKVGARLATSARATALLRVPRTRSGGALNLLSAEKRDAQPAEAETQEEKMDRAKALIEQVRGSANSRLDQKIKEISNPEAPTTAQKQDKGEESKEEKMARAKAIIEKARGTGSASKASDDPPKTSTGIGGSWAPPKDESDIDKHKPTGSGSWGVFERYSSKTATLPYRCNSKVATPLGRAIIRSSRPHAVVC